MRPSHSPSAARDTALYAFTRDRRGEPSRCCGACAKAWPVYFAAGQLRAGKGVKQSLISTTRRRDGRRQVTYNAWPLYYYVGDRKPSQVLCRNVDAFGGTWLVVRTERPARPLVSARCEKARRSEASRSA